MLINKLLATLFNELIHFFVPLILSLGCFRLKNQEIHVDELSAWYSQIMQKELENFRKDVRKLFDKIEQTLEFMESTSQKLESGPPEAASDKIHETAIKCANRLSSSIKDSINDINLPNLDEVVFSDLKGINDELTNLTRTITDAGRRYVPPISKAKLLKREITELSYFLKDIAKSQKKLDQIVKDFDYIKIIEENFQKITELNKLKERLSELNIMQSQCEGMIEEVESEKDEIIKQKVSIEKEPVFAELHEIDGKLKKKQMKLTQALRIILDKPFKKFNKSVDDGLTNISEDKKIALEGYMNDPFETFTSEELGYPILKALLKEIQERLEMNRLEVKKKLIPKIKTKVEQVLNDSILSLQKDLKALLTEKKTLISNSQELFTIQDQLNKKLHEQEKRESDVQLEFSKVIAEKNWCEDRINTIKKTLEKNFRKELEEDITISIENT